MTETAESIYSTLEVDNSVNLPQHKPNDEDMPEPVAEKAESPAAPTFLFGIRRRTFWTILGVVLASMIIGIAIGVGVGVGTKRKEEPGHKSANNIVSDSTKVIRRGVASSSRLAAANYTDAGGAEHSQVYYQNATSMEIWMADYNDATANWTFSPVLPRDNNSAVIPKNGTPNAAYNWLHDYSIPVSLYGLLDLQSRTNKMTFG